MPAPTTLITTAVKRTVAADIERIARAHGISTGDVIEMLVCAHAIDVAAMALVRETAGLIRSKRLAGKPLEDLVPLDEALSTIV